MKAVMTGATGFLGSYLLAELRKSYEEIVCLARTPRKLKAEEDDQVKVVQGDVTAPTDLMKDALVGADHLYHSAAKVGSWPKDPQRGYVQTNVDGTKTILSMATEAGVGRVVYTSSYFALGETGVDPVTEDWNVPPSFDHPYVTTKYEAGKVVERWVAEHPDSETEVVVVNPTTIVGVGMDNPVSASLVDYLNGKLPGLPGGGRTVLNFVLAESVAEGHVLAAKQGRAGQKYLLGCEDMMLRDFYGMFGAKIDRKPPRKVPTFLVKLYARMLEFGRNPAMTVADFNVARRHWAYNDSKAREELGYAPKPVIEVVEPYLTHLKYCGLLKPKVAKKLSDIL